MTSAPFLAERPRRKRVRLTVYWSEIRSSLGSFLHLLQHTLSAFEAAPRVPEPVKKDSPQGTIRANTLQLIQALSEKSLARSERLEQKATSTLSALGVVAPLIAALAVYAAREPDLLSWSGAPAIALLFLSVVSLVLGFIAALRSLSIRGYHELGIASVVDPRHRTVRRFNTDFYGRGLLHTHAVREAVNDHVADFVRASQLLLGLSILLLLLAATAALPIVSAAAKEESDSKKQLARAVTEASRAISGSSRKDQHQARQLQKLHRDIAELRLELSNARTANVRTARDAEQIRAEMARMREDIRENRSPAPLE